MKAVVFHEHGGTEKLVYEDFPDPQAGVDDVIVKVRSCSINHIDIWIRQGIPAYKMDLPHVSGCDVSGVVEDVGKNVADVNVGDKVIVAPGLSCFKCDECISGNDNLCDSFKIFGAGTHGGYAEFVKAPSNSIIQMPNSLTFVESAAFPLTFLTAYHMLVSRIDLRVGQNILIIAAGSGIGTAAVRIAKLLGARVIATVGSEEKVEKLEIMGVDDIINYNQEDFAKRVLDLTDGRGVDAVFENVGPETWEKSISCLAKNGKLVTCGATSGPNVDISLRTLFMKQLAIYGSVMGTRKELFEIIRFVLAGELRITIDSVFELKNARKAQEKMLARKNFGKIMIEMEN
ncbi:MAG: zinc-binding dehydrogenase [Candidatus Anammoxibacter sp.]